MKHKMVIMQVLPELNSGGVERGAVDIANFIVKSGFKSIIISAGGRLEGFLNHRVKHIKLNVNSKNPITIFLNIRRIRKLIIANQVDILHARSRAPAWSCYFAIRGTNCKLLNTFHGTHSLNLIGKETSKIKKRYNEIMLKGSKVIAVSNFIKNHIKENYPELFDKNKITVIHRGVDVNNFNPAKISQEMKVNLIRKLQIPDDKKIILLPARITHWKGHEFLIDALKILKRDDYLCLFVGDYSNKNDYKKRLEQRIINSNLEGKVRFAGNVTNMAVIYSICDIVISASTNPEALGRVAIEAQAMERIIIATNIGGSKETIIDGETGFLIENRNIKDLSDKIDQILSMNDEDIRRIELKARENVVKNFSNDLMYKKTLKVYQNLLK